MHARGGGRSARGGGISPGSSPPMHTLHLQRLALPLTPSLLSPLSPISPTPCPLPYSPLPQPPTPPPTPPYLPLPPPTSPPAKIILSTSTLSSKALVVGGFGPVNRECYAIGYGIREAGCGAHVMSYGRDAAGFVSALEESIRDMREVSSQKLVDK